MLAMIFTLPPAALALHQCGQPGCGTGICRMNTPECFASRSSPAGASSAGATVCSLNALRPSLAPTAMR